MASGACDQVLLKSIIACLRYDDLKFDIVMLTERKKECGEKERIWQHMWPNATSAALYRCSILH